MINFAHGDTNNSRAYALYFNIISVLGLPVPVALFINCYCMFRFGRLIEKDCV